MRPHRAFRRCIIGVDELYNGRLDAIALYFPMTEPKWLARAGKGKLSLYSSARGESARIQRTGAILMAHIGCPTGAIALTTNKQ